MSSVATPPLIAVLERSEDIIDFLCAALESDDFRHVTLTSHCHEDQDQALVAFLAQHNPHGLIWDIGVPYEANWACFTRVRESGVLRHRGIVLTTANPMLLQEWLGGDESVELVGKVYGLDDILRAVRRALARHGHAAC